MNFEGYDFRRREKEFAVCCEGACARRLQRLHLREVLFPVLSPHLREAK